MCVYVQQLVASLLLLLKCVCVCASPVLARVSRDQYFVWGSVCDALFVYEVSASPKLAFGVSRSPASRVWAA